MSWNPPPEGSQDTLAPLSQHCWFVWLKTHIVLDNGCPIIRTLCSSSDVHKSFECPTPLHPQGKMETINQKRSSWLDWNHLDLGAATERRMSKSRSLAQAGEGGPKRPISSTKKTMAVLTCGWMWLSCYQEGPLRGGWEELGLECRARTGRDHLQPVAKHPPSPPRAQPLSLSPNRSINHSVTEIVTQSACDSVSRKRQKEKSFCRGGDRLHRLSLLQRNNNYVRLLCA